MFSLNIRRTVAAEQSHLHLPVLDMIRSGNNQATFPMNIDRVKNKRNTETCSFLLQDHFHINMIPVGPGREICLAVYHNNNTTE
jgi:hypothetical protein